MRLFLLDANLGTDEITIQHEEISNQSNKKEHEQQQNDTLKNKLVRFEGINLKLYKHLPFTINEADYWFQYAEDIYNGKLKRKDIPFFREGSRKCYINASIFQTIDLRNVLLLYDTVYLALPIEDRIDSFLEHQNVSISDLIELIEMGKLVIMLPNQEVRYDQKLLLEAYQCSPLSIIGRRGINALLATHLVETKLQYEKRFPNIYEVASDLFIRGAKEGDAFIQSLAKMLAWPVTAATASFRYLNQNSPISISNFGVNLIVEENIRGSDLQDAISFELTMNAESAHFATALQSTYFPFKHKTTDRIYSDQGISNLMGDLLKMYWYDVSSLEQIERITENNYSENNFLKLFEVNHHVKATKIASLADEYDTPNAFFNLLLRLDKMDSLSRRQTINEYNDLLFEVSQKSSQSSGGFIKMLLSGTSFLPLDYTLSFALASFGLIHDKVSNIKSLRKSREIELIEKCVRDSDIQKGRNLDEDIYILDKMSTVVTLKE